MMSGAELLRDVSWYFQYCIRVHPGFGRARGYLGGVFAMSERYLDAVYYYMSAMVSDVPFETRESLESVFGLASKKQFALEQEMKNESDEDTGLLRVRLFGLRFLNVIRCVWTNVRLFGGANAQINLDNVPQYAARLAFSMRQLLARWERDEIRYILFCLE